MASELHQVGCANGRAKIGVRLCLAVHANAMRSRGSILSPTPARAWRATAPGGKPSHRASYNTSPTWVALVLAHGALEPNLRTA